MSHLHVFSLISRTQELLSHPMTAKTFGNPLFQLSAPFEWNAINAAQRVAQAETKWLELPDVERTEEAVAKRDESFKRLATLRELNRETSHEAGETTMTAVRRVCIPKDAAVTDERLKNQTRKEIIDLRMAGRLAEADMAKRYVSILRAKQALRDEETRTAEQTAEDVFFLMNSSDIAISTGEFSDQEIANDPLGGFSDMEAQLDAVQDKLADAVIWLWRQLDAVQSHRDGVLRTRDELKAQVANLCRDLGVNLGRVEAQTSSLSEQLAKIEADLAATADAVGDNLDAQLEALPAEPRPVRVVKSDARIAREQAETEAAAARQAEDAKRAATAAKAAATRAAKAAKK